MSDDTLAYTVTRRRQQRRMILRVRADGSLRVTAPVRASKADVHEFVTQNVGWIDRKREELKALPQGIQRGSEDFEQARVEILVALEELMPLWCERMGVEVPPRVSIKVMSSRWGSCNATLNKINLNAELARRGRDGLEYVLVHELAHLFHQNHGPGFYALMDAQLPDWKARRTALRRKR
ncbi:M48 family metallopeptidase [Demequina sp. NBRC 110055]|uniref:M48 family metallopeptidase n=1 Tax=Demequina sp. NBRC 110055 TaxID=1570344 RepID=UPI0009FE1A4C|nr:SprT-like domain-containing protein [Demequina sp. NBRC 110055]